MTVHLDPARLAEAARSGDLTDDEIEHVADCRLCTVALRDPELEPALAALRHEPLPFDARQAADALASRLAARGARVRRLTFAVVAPILAAAAAAWVFVHRAPGDEHVTVQVPSHATVSPQPGAEVTRTGEADEVLSLRGEASFQVRPLVRGDRFRVRAAGDELEVHGTTFRVVADSSGFREVAVTEGVVEVRPACCEREVLRAGGSWHRPEVPVVPVSTGGAVASAEPATTTPESSTEGPRPTPPGGSGDPRREVPAADLMKEGIAAFDEGRYGAAASLLDRAVRGEPSAAWARDARVMAGAAAALSAPLASVPSVGASAASFELAAQRAARGGDAARAAVARFAAAQRATGDVRAKRMCSLGGDAALPPTFRAQAAAACRP